MRKNREVLSTEYIRFYYLRVYGLILILLGDIAIVSS